MTTPLSLALTASLFASLSMTLASAWSTWSTSIARMFADAISDPPSTAGIVGFFAEKGILGIIIIGLLIVVRHLYLELRAERNARLEDVKLYRDSIIDTSTKVHDAVAELARVAEFLERRHERSPGRGPSSI